MDRDDLLSLLQDLTDNELVLKTNGTLFDTNGDEWSPDQVQEVLTELRDGLDRLQRVVTWAKLAPEYKPWVSGDPTNTGLAVDANGNPY